MWLYLCKLCYSKLELFEIATARAGLGTKLELRCCNVDCLSLLCQKSFYTTKKEGSAYNVNKKAVLAGRLAGKGRSGMAKILSVIGLSSPVCKKSYKNNTQHWEKISNELLIDNLKMASSRAKQLIIKDSELDPNTEVIDVPTCFDGSWMARGWVAKRGIAAAIAQNTSQVVDVIFKSSSCRQCTKIEERRKKLANVTHWNILNGASAMSLNASTTMMVVLR